MELTTGTLLRRIVETEVSTSAHKLATLILDGMAWKEGYNGLERGTAAFTLVDKAEAFVPATSIVGIKNVSHNEPFFPGHFPGNPVMPGVMQIEAMAQTGGILVLSSVPDPENYWPYLVGIENCRFRKSVIPGDTVIFKCELLAPIRRGIAKMTGKAYVSGQVVCEAEMTASLVRKS
mgnify:CR=1 FL=1